MSRTQTGCPLLPPDQSRPSDGRQLDNPTWYRCLACGMGRGSGECGARAPSGGQRLTLPGRVGGHGPQRGAQGTREARTGLRPP